MLPQAETLPGLALYSLPLCREKSLGLEDIKTKSILTFTSLVDMSLSVLESLCDQNLK